MRRRWRQGAFAFLYVQLAAFLPLEKNTLAGSEWAELREAQRKTLAVRNTGMAVATDIGDARDIHPRNKREVGLRLARIALKQSYGVHLQAGGPTLISARRVGNRMQLRFANVARGLVLNGDRLQGFSIADTSRQFQPAQARVAGRDTIIVWNPGVKRPRAVRFGWVDNPQESNLFNSEGLPASPFRTDNWPRLTDGRVYAF
jgi:sialate O-acetylesterase